MRNLATSQQIFRLLTFKSDQKQCLLVFADLVCMLERQFTKQSCKTVERLGLLHEQAFLTRT